MAVFTLNRAGGNEILKAVCAEEVSALAAQVVAAAGPEAFLSTKVTATRFVATIKVPAEAQATDGVLSRAATAVGLTINAYKKSGNDTERKKVIGFVSKSQWRWSFWSKKPWALSKARETPGEKLIRYRQLPESTRKK